MNVRVLIAEQDPELRSLFRTHVETVPGFEVVGHALDEDRAIDLCAELTPEMVLIGLDEDRPIDDAVAQVRERCPDVKVVVVTAPSARGAEPAAADAVLTRPLGADEFTVSLLEVARA